MTPLHWACLKGHADVVGVLLRLGGADAFATASKGIFAGKTAIDLVASQEGERAAAVREVLLQQMGASLFQLRKVVGRGGYGVVVKATRRDSGQVLALKAVRKQTSGDAAPPSGFSPFASKRTEEKTPFQAGTAFGTQALTDAGARWPGTVVAAGPVKLYRLRRDAALGLLGDLATVMRDNFQQNVLGSIEMFKALAPSDISLLIDAFSEQRYVKHDHIIKQGDDGDAFYIVRHGKVRVSIANP